MKRASDDTKYIVYLVLERTSGMGYVGVTCKTLKIRWEQHIRDSRRGNGSSGSLQEAIRRYGRESFDVLVLQENVHSDEVKRAEHTWIFLKSTMSPLGFNKLEGGRGVCGYRCTDDERKAMSAMRRSINGKSEVRERVSDQFKKLWQSADHRRTISDRRKETWKRPEYRDAVSSMMREKWDTDAYKSLISETKRVTGPVSGRYKGVHFCKSRNRWEARLRADGKKISCGRFASEEDAARAYDVAARLHSGPGCFLNFPTDQERADWLELKASLESKRKSK
jgi:group I intron endonuclease